LTFIKKFTFFVETFAKNMSLFRPDDFLSKLTRVELKKHFQKKRIVRTLYLHGALSIAELVKCVEVSTPTMQGLLEELITENIVKSLGTGSSKGGRRPVMYGLRRKAFYVLSIDIGTHSTRFTIFDSANKKVVPVKEISLLIKNEMQSVQAIYESAMELVKESKIKQELILGVGIDMPGLIEREKGINHSLFNFDEPIAEIFSRLFNKPVVIENDAQAKALAEFRFGKAVGKKHVLVIQMGWGVGMGMILNGKPYYGAHGFSGEFAHIPMVDEKGYLCSCGMRGCLETVSSGAALQRYALEGIDAGEMTLIQDMAHGKRENITTRLIIEAAQSGDQFAIRIISKIGFNLGKGIASLLQILNPEMVILAGRLADTGSYLMTPIYQALQQYSFAIIRNDIEITHSELGEDSSLLGNVISLLEMIFES
jgi:N-acetylglucosamine repressor